MNKITPRTLKGFRDFLPNEARKRQYVINILKRVFESYGFEPLETPIVEYEDILLGKYGEEEKLIYKFTTPGDDKVALRYDQTVPLARVLAQYGSTGEQKITLPFKRYQIQNVYRAENTQKGRYREFIQCDADIIGENSIYADAEILNLTLDIYKKLGIPVTIKINDRINFESLDKKYIAAIDKLEKIGESEVLSEMISKGMTDTDAKKALSELQNKPQTESIEQIFSILEKMGADTTKIKYEPTLARGLDYYTGLIFETVAEGSTGSICSGGRWDEMIAKFSENDIPAVGFGLGFDRTIELMEEMDLFPKNLFTARVLILNIPGLESLAIKTAQDLRRSGINTDVFLNSSIDKAKQFSYAEKKNIPYTLLPAEDGTFTIGYKDEKGQILKEDSLTFVQLFALLTK